VSHGASTQTSRSPPGNHRGKSRYLNSPCHPSTWSASATRTGSCASAAANAASAAAVRRAAFRQVLNCQGIGRLLNLLMLFGRHRGLSYTRRGTARRSAGLVSARLRRRCRSPGRTSAAAKGDYSVGATRYPRLQFWSADEYLSGVRPHLPAMADPYTGKPIQRDMLTG